MPGHNRAGLARVLRGIDVPRAKLHRELDALFFLVVSWKYGDRCIRCGTPPKEIVTKAGVTRIQALTPHHFFCRSYWGTRWEPDNGFLLCYPCHIKWAQTRHEEFRDLVISKIGEAKFGKLKYQAYNGGKPDPTLVRIHLKERLREIQEKQVKALETRMA